MAADDVPSRSTARIRPAALADVPGVRTVLANALEADPMLRWLFPTTQPQRLSRIAIFFSAQVEQASCAGTAFLAEDQKGTVLGAALWFRPGLSRAPTLPLPPELMPIVCGEGTAHAFAEEFAAAREGSPSSSDPVLATLGTVPEARGRGIGAALMHAARAELGAPAWLESTNPRNLPFYRREGFESVHEAPFLEGTTTLTRMVRAEPSRPHP